MYAICTAYRVLWEVIDVVQVVAAQAVGRASDRNTLGLGPELCIEWI